MSAWVGKGLAGGMEGKMKERRKILVLAMLKCWRESRIAEDGKLLCHDFTLVFRPVELKGKGVKASGKSFRVVLSPEQVPDELEPGTLYEVYEEVYMMSTPI